MTPSLTDENLQACYELISGRQLKRGRAFKACVSTFGCQMNARDSEKLAGMLKAAGYVLTEEEQGADFIILNTCTVREHADERLLGRLGQLKHQKEKNSDCLIALCGCMIQDETQRERLLRSYPFVDLLFGTHALSDFPALLRQTLERNAKHLILSVPEEDGAFPEDLPVERKYSFKSGVNVTYGCDNFCTYCIVPYVRGRERSRKAEDILKEISQLAADGVREIMLLGQNVNSYGAVSDDPVDFPKLLERVCRIDGIERVRFMTSHPKDLSPALIDVIASEEKICRHLHLPVQSGSTRILEKMNRRYTRQEYISLVAALKERIPDLSLTSDLIVGFPGETEEEFQETMTLVEEVGFDACFTFIYSPRSGTLAAGMEEQIDEAVKHERFDRLLSLVQRVAAKRSARFLGRTVDLLVEERGRKEGWMTGRSEHNLLVHFPGDSSLIGRFVPVKLTEDRSFYYFGEIAGGAW